MSTRIILPPDETPLSISMPDLLKIAAKAAKAAAEEAEAANIRTVGLLEGDRPSNEPKHASPASTLGTEEDSLFRHRKLRSGGR